MQMNREEFPEVEILSLLDNKKRSVGMKRQALLDIAEGEFVCYIDDDDWIAETYIRRIKEGLCRMGGQQVLVFDSLCSRDDRVGNIVLKHGLQYENMEISEPNPTRKPWHIHPWRRDYVSMWRFSDTSWGEDWDWLKQFVPGMGEEQQLSLDCEPLYHYQFSSAGSETQ